ncbi:MAG: nitroreductase family protein [Muribaculaceae bacterium]|nr:nitroreductase family protein [Muribaculaceae bacterium]
MDLTRLMRERFSCRKYSEYIPSKEEITLLLEAANIAPSACNRQPWHFTIVTPGDTTGRNAILKAYSRDWIASANTFIIVGGIEDSAWVRPFDNHNHIDIDIAIATEHICLKATEIGLATCWICNFDPATLIDNISFPEGVTPKVILPVGKPAPEQVVPNKTRKPLSEIVEWR